MNAALTAVLALAALLAHPGHAGAVASGAPDSIAARRDSVPDSLARAAGAESAAYEPPPPPVLPTAPVYLGGSVLWTVRLPLGYPDPGARAEAIRARLKQAVASEHLPADSVRADSTSFGAIVRIGPLLLLHVVPGDRGPGDLRSPYRAAMDLVPAIRRGLLRERAQLAPGRLAGSVLLTILLSFLYVSLIPLLLRLSGIAGTSLSRHLEGWLRRLGIQSGLFGGARSVRFFRGLVWALSIALLIVLGYAYLSVVFSFFPWTQGWSTRLAQFAFQNLRKMLTACARAAPDLVLAGAIAYVAHLLIRSASRLLDAASRGVIAIPGLHPELAKPTKQLLRVVLWIVVLVIIYPLIPGSQTPVFRGVSILLGVVVSFGSSSLIENLLAGLVLTYARSYRPGERIGVGDLVGDVTAAGLLTTKLRTIKNEEVTLGNAQVLRSSVRNYTRIAAEGEGLILHTTVTIGYAVPWRQVHGLLIEAAAKTDGLEAEPDPFVLQRKLDDFYVEYEINAHTKRPDQMARLYGAIHQNIQDAFRAAGVEIMSPHYRAIRRGDETTVPSEAG